MTLIRIFFVISAMVLGVNSLANARPLWGCEFLLQNTNSLEGKSHGYLGTLVKSINSLIQERDRTWHLEKWSPEEINALRQIEGFDSKLSNYEVISVYSWYVKLVIRNLQREFKAVGIVSGLKGESVEPWELNCCNRGCPGCIFAAEPAHGVEKYTALRQLQWKIKKRLRPFPAEQIPQSLVLYQIQHKLKDIVPATIFERPGVTARQRKVELNSR